MSEHSQRDRDLQQFIEYLVSAEPKTALDDLQAADYLSQLQADNQRLREALEEIADGGETFFGHSGSQCAYMAGYALKVMGYR